MPGLRAVDEQSRCLGTNKILPRQTLRPLPRTFPASLPEIALTSLALSPRSGRVGHRGHQVSGKPRMRQHTTVRHRHALFADDMGRPSRAGRSVGAGQLTDAPASRCRLSLMLDGACAPACAFAGYVSPARCHSCPHHCLACHRSALQLCCSPALQLFSAAALQPRGPSGSTAPPFRVWWGRATIGQPSVHESRPVVRWTGVLVFPSSGRVNSVG